MQQDLGFAKLDHDRETRCGFPEVIYGPGKTSDQLLEIARAILARSGVVIATRVDPEPAARLVKELGAEYHARSRLVVAREGPRPTARGRVVILSAGTADQPVAEEAAITAQEVGAEIELVPDVGVAGLHRLAGASDLLRSAHAVVVVAGMEGALASVVGGLVSAPVVAVPTSVGYGASFEGVTPLLTMLSGCAPGVAVVNIDGGFAAGYYAAMIARQSTHCKGAS